MCTSVSKSVEIEPELLLLFGDQDLNVGVLECLWRNGLNENMSRKVMKESFLNVLSLLVFQRIIFVLLLFLRGYLILGTNSIAGEH